MCSNVDLSSRFLEFLPESNQRPRDRQSCALTNQASFTLSQMVRMRPGEHWRTSVCVNNSQSFCHQPLKKGEDGAKLE